MRSSTLNVFAAPVIYATEPQSENRYQEAEQQMKTILRQQTRRLQASR
jgi:hypothetical protein